MFLIVKNSKISLKSLGLGPKEEKCCKYLAPFLRWHLQVTLDCTSPGLDMLLQTLATWHQNACAIGVLVLFLVRYKECHPILECVISKKEKKRTSLPEEIALAPSVFHLALRYLCFTEVNAACPTITLTAFCHMPPSLFRICQPSVG